MIHRIVRDQVPTDLRAAVLDVQLLQRYQVISCRLFLAHETLRALS